MALEAASQLEGESAAVAERGQARGGVSAVSQRKADGGNDRADRSDEQAIVVCSINTVEHSMVSLLECRSERRSAAGKSGNSKATRCNAHSNQQQEQTARRLSAELLPLLLVHSFPLCQSLAALWQRLQSSMTVQNFRATPPCISIKCIQPATVKLVL